MRHALTLRSRSSESQEIRSDKRRRGYTQTLTESTRPQHGGRAASSHTQAGDNCVYAELVQSGGQSLEHFALAGPVRAAKFFPAHELHIGIALPDAFFENCEHLVASEQIIPELRYGFAVQCFQTFRQRSGLRGAGASWPI